MKTPLFLLYISSKQFPASTLSFSVYAWIRGWITPDPDHTKLQSSLISFMWEVAMLVILHVPPISRQPATTQCALIYYMSERKLSPLFVNLCIELNKQAIEHLLQNKCSLVIPLVCLSCLICLLWPQSDNSQLATLLIDIYLFCSLFCSEIRWRLLFASNCFAKLTYRSLRLTLSFAVVFTVCCNSNNHNKCNYA